MNRRLSLGSAIVLARLDPERLLGTNDRLRVGFIRIGGRARWLLGGAQDGTAERQLASGVAAQVRALAKARKLSANKTIVELIESGMEAEKRKQQEFFELAERFCSVTDSEEVKRLGD